MKEFYNPVNSRMEENIMKENRMSSRTRCSSIVSAVCLFLLLGVAQAMAATYYVSTTGNNANDGLSEGAAWRTVTYAGSKVSGWRHGIHQGGSL